MSTLLFRSTLVVSLFIRPLENLNIAVVRNNKAANKAAKGTCIIKKIYQFPLLLMALLGKSSSKVSHIFMMRKFTNSLFTALISHITKPHCNYNYST